MCIWYRVAVTYVCHTDVCVRVCVLLCGAGVVVCAVSLPRKQKGLIFWLYVYKYMYIIITCVNATCTVYPVRVCASGAVNLHIVRKFLCFTYNHWFMVRTCI